MEDITINSYNYNKYLEAGIQINGTEYFSNGWRCPSCGESLPDEYERKVCPLCQESEDIYNTSAKAVKDLCEVLKYFSGYTPREIINSFVDEWEKENEEESN